MRTCTNCGAQFPDDELICPVCGHEVQLVPDYVTIESKIQEDRKRKEDEAQRRREELAKEQAIEKRKQQIRRKIILTVVLLAAAAAVILFTAVSIHLKSQSKSFSYQYKKAQNAYEIGDYQDALTYITDALKIDAGNEDGLYLEAEIYVALDKKGDAEKVLEKLIAANGDYTKAYDLLIKLYTEDKNSDAIRTLLKNCKNSDVLAKYKDYLPQAPTISPEGGTYDSLQTVTISAAANGTIYYTTDDSKPDSSSEKYSGSFRLKEGTTTVKAIVVTDKGLTSDVASQEFSNELDTPAAPKITPSSGTYTHVKGRSTGSGSSSGSLSESVSSSSADETDTDITHITVTVPDGYTCYYAFDQTPTKSSNKYTKPVSMRQGEHIFYAVLCSKEGKLGKVASATYIYSIVTPTATPTPTAIPTQSASNTYNPVDTYNSETVATPTPTATPTAAAPTPDASSSTSSSNTENEEHTGTEGNDKETDKSASENNN